MSVLQGIFIELDENLAKINSDFAMSIVYDRFKSPFPMRLRKFAFVKFILMCLMSMRKYTSLCVFGSFQSGIIEAMWIG